MPGCDVRPEDLEKPSSYGVKATQTFWIDKRRKVIVKSLQVIDRDQPYDPVRAPLHPTHFHIEAVTLYPVVELNQPIPETDFDFAPPEDASLVKEFPLPYGATASAVQPSPSPKSPDLTGKMEPDLTLHALDSSALQLSSLRGHPVLIDLWATWCGPCLMEMPLIDHIFKAEKDAGLVVLGLDHDEDPKAALDFMKRKGYGWADYHADMQDDRGFPHRGIPLLVLIDAEGKIVYYYEGADDDPGLVSAVKQLGPAFAAALDHTGQ